MSSKKPRKISLEIVELDEDPWCLASFTSKCTVLLCCCIPCSIVGLVNLVVAQSEYHKGSKARAEMRKSNATFCTMVSLLVGVSLASAAIYATFAIWPELGAKGSQLRQNIRCNFYKVLMINSELCTDSTLTSKAPQLTTRSIPMSETNQPNPSGVTKPNPVATAIVRTKITVVASVTNSTGN